MNDENPEHTPCCDGSALSKDMSEDEASAARRETLKRLGLLGAVTAPALLVLLKPDRAAAVAVTSGVV